MAGDKNVGVDVEFKAKGLKALRGQWLDFAGDLAEPMILLAAGATKAQALWGGLQGVFLTRVLGPMGMVSGAAVALLTVTGKLVSKWKEFGLVGAASISRMTLEFRPLLGSMELAKSRVKELYDFTAKTPFRMAEVAKGNKILQTLTKGALAGKVGMELVGDASAVANTKFDETSRSIGRLYDGLMSGRPVGEASMRLQEMGLISGRTRNALEGMQKAGVSGSETWALVERELKKNKGAAQDLSQELEGLKSTQEDVQLQMEAGFGKGFLEGEKATIKATTGAMEKMAPVAEYLGEQIGWVSEKMDKSKARMVEMLTSIPGLTGGLKFLANAFAVVTAGVVVATGAALTKFLVSVVLVTRATNRQVVAMGLDTTVKAVNIGVTRNLALANGQLKLAYLDVRSGAVLSALANVKLAAANTLAAFKTNALAASTALLSGALRVTTVAIKFVVVQLRAMAAAILMNKFYLITTLILSLGAALLHFSNESKKAAAALRDYKKASDDVADSLEAQRRGMETVTDLRKHETDVIRRLGEAYREEAKYRREGNQELQYFAKQKIDSLRKELEATKEVTVASLRMSAAEKSRGDRSYREGKSVKDLKKGAELEDAGADERVRILEKRAQEAAAKQKSAQADIAAEDSTRGKMGSMNLEGTEEKIRLQQEIVELEKETQAWRDKRSSGFYKAGVDRSSVDGGIKKREGRLALKRESLAILEARTGVGAQSEMGLTSDSELAKLEAKLAVYKQIKAAEDDVSQAQKKVSGLGSDAADKDKADARNVLNAARARESGLKGLKGKFGGFGSQRAAQGAEIDIERKRKERGDDASGKKVYEAQRALDKARKDREDTIARTKIDAESAVAALRSKGMDAEEKALGFAREKLEMAREQKKLGDAEYDAQLKILKAREEAMGERAKERGQSMASSLAEKSLRRKSDDAKRDGDQVRSKKLRDEADKVRDDQRKRELEKQAGGVTSDPAQIKKYVDAVMSEEKSARAGQRKRDESEDSLGRRRTEAQGEGGLQSAILRRQGKTREAAQVEEGRQRKLDDIKREELKKKYRDDGFSGKEADNLANRDVKVGQAQRGIDALKARGDGGHIVASSLAKIGGGGRVAGRDPNTKILEKMEALLKEIRDQEKEDVTSVF